MKGIFFIKLIFFLIVPLCSLDQAVFADSVEQSAQEIYYKTLSPFCPGRALADCPTEQAVNLKAKIRSELESGKTRDEVYENILNEYGQHLRAVPTMSGWNSLAWIIPGVIVLIGLFVVILKIKSTQAEEGEEVGNQN